MEFLYCIAQGILYTIPIYTMVGYDRKADKCFYFLFFITASFLYFSMFGAMLISCTPSQILASILVSIILTCWNIFSGFLITRPVCISVNPGITLHQSSWMHGTNWCPEPPIKFLKLSLLQALPVWWRWFYWCNPVAWTIYGVIASQFGDISRTVTVPGNPNKIVKEILKETYGMKHDFLGYVVLAHFGYILIFLFLFAYGTKTLNFQKR